MNAGAAHSSESEFESDVGLSGAIAAHFGDSVADVPWWSSQCAFASSPLCLFVSGRGFTFLRFVACRLCLLVPPGRKNASCASLFRYRFATLTLSEFGAGVGLGLVQQT